MSDRQQDARRVFVGGLSYDTDTEGLRHFFQQFGDVADAKVMRSAEDGRHRGFGFVRFASKRSASRALAARNLRLDNRVIEVKRAQAKTELSSSPGALAAAASPPASGAAAGAPRLDAQSGTRKIFAGGLHYSTDDSSLRAYFSQFGEVASAQVMYSRETQKSRGFGFVVFAAAAAVDQVMRSTMHEVDGKMVEVKRAVPKGGKGGGESPPHASRHASKPPQHASGKQHASTAANTASAGRTNKGARSQQHRSVATGARGSQSAAAPAPSAVPSSTTSWAAVLAAGGGSGGTGQQHPPSSNGAGTSGAESVTASVVSSVFDEAVEGVGAGMHEGDAASGMHEGARGGEGLPSLAAHSSDVWGLNGGGTLPATPAADSASVHSYDGGGGGGGASVMSSASFHQQRQRADSQASFRSEGGMTGASGGVGAPPPMQVPAHAPGGGFGGGGAGGAWGRGAPSHTPPFMQAVGGNMHNQPTQSQWAVPSQWVTPVASGPMLTAQGGGMQGGWGAQQPAANHAPQPMQPSWGVNAPAPHMGSAGYTMEAPAGYQAPSFGPTASVLGFGAWPSMPPPSMPPPELPAELSPGRSNAGR